MIDKKTFLKNFKDCYNYLYENQDVEDALYPYVDDFDFQLKTSKAFKAFVRDIVLTRGDVFSSDREAIAFMMVFNKMRKAV